MQYTQYVLLIIRMWCLTSILLLVHEFKSVVIEQNSGYEGLTQTLRYHDIWVRKYKVLFLINAVTKMCGCIAPHFFTSTLDGNEWSVSRIGRINLGDIAIAKIELGAR
jgi:hypothetical protein